MKISGTPHAFTDWRIYFNFYMLNVMHIFCIFESPYEACLFTL